MDFKNINDILDAISNLSVIVILSMSIYLVFSFINLIKTKKMHEKLIALGEKVTALTSATQSATALLGGLKASLDEAIAHAKDNEGDLSKLEELSASIEANTAQLSKSVEDNTPAAV
jgi:hypothetical protein